MENILLWTQDHKHFCEFTISKKQAKELGLIEEKEINLKELFPIEQVHNTIAE